MSSIRVSQLNIYPVKSTRGLSLSDLCIGPLGPHMDRRWMIIDADNGHFITQREHSRLCLVGATLSGTALTLTAPTLDPLLVSQQQSQSGSSRQVKIWQDWVEAFDCGDQAAQWLSSFLKTSVRLVFMADDCHRLVDQNFSQQSECVSFADGFPILLISESSLEDFNQHIDSPIHMNRFRPNIVVSGCAAYAEDHWQTIQIGLLSFELVKPCSRCVIPSIDPQTANKQVEISKALAKHRRRDGAVYFGQNLVANEQGIISVGDQVTVLA